MALPEPVADPTIDTAPVGKRALETIGGKIKENVPAGRKTPRTDANSSGFYLVSQNINILCSTIANTTPVNGDL